MPNYCRNENLYLTLRSQIRHKYRSVFDKPCTPIAFKFYVYIQDNQEW